MKGIEQSKNLSKSTISEAWNEVFPKCQSLKLIVYFALSFRRRKKCHSHLTIELNLRIYSLVPCTGGFIFIDFTLACCQPNIFTNHVLNHLPLPFTCPWTPTPPSKLIWIATTKQWALTFRTLTWAWQLCVIMIPNLTFCGGHKKKAPGHDRVGTPPNTCHQGSYSREYINMDKSLNELLTQHNLTHSILWLDTSQPTDGGLQNWSSSDSGF